MIKFPIGRTIAFSRVLVAASLSETSDHVIDCLEPLKKIGTKQIVLVHAMNIRDVGTLYNRLREMALPKLEAQKYTLEQIGFCC